MARLTTASYVKIGLIILLALTLLGVAGVGGCTSWDFRMGAGKQMGNARVDAASVKNLSIDWAAGSVKVLVDEGTSSEIEITETSTGGLTKVQQMRWDVSGDTLKIDYGSWFSCFSLARKDLEVRIPQSLAKSMGTLEVDGASGRYEIADLACSSIKFRLASGEAFLRDVSSADLALDVASGQLNAEGTFTDSVDIKLASGHASVVCADVAPKKIDTDVASGDALVSLPKNSGFTARIDKASGTFQSDFATTQQGDGVYVYEDGATDIRVKMASGQFNLRETS